MNQILDTVNSENASLKKQMDEAKAAAAKYNSVNFLQKY